MHSVKRWVWQVGFALACLSTIPALAQAPTTAARNALLERARQGFDGYMLSDEFEGSRLARVQKEVFSASWNRMRDRFGEAAVAKLEGKVSPEETQRRYQTIVRESFVEVERTVTSNGKNLGFAPHDALIRWERALNEQLRTHISADPGGCNLLNVLRRPSSPAEVGTKIDLVAAFWSAFGAGASTPIGREFEAPPAADSAALGTALAAVGASNADRLAILADGGKLRDIGSLSCSARLSFSNALLTMQGDAQDRLLAHAITRRVN